MGSRLSLLRPTGKNGIYFALAETRTQGWFRYITTAHGSVVGRSVPRASIAAPVAGSALRTGTAAATVAAARRDIAAFLTRILRLCALVRASSQDTVYLLSAHQTGGDGQIGRFVFGAPAQKWSGGGPQIKFNVDSNFG